ncbi:MAG: hypothetical protein J6Z01_14600 [Bacteroidales bacterium]|nr:hypothetical protein [Bacteroidales bacterium]
MKLITTLILLMLAVAGMGKSTDIIFILDSCAAFGNGHIAVLIGNENTGWHYVSINGTGSMAKPWGINTNADTGIVITDEAGLRIRGLKRAIRRACEINPNERHRYRQFKRIKTTAEEDSAVLSAAKNTASSIVYGIIGPGQSCIDVAQSAFSALVKKRRLDKRGNAPGRTDLIPKRWFRKIELRIKIANRRSRDGKGKISEISENY